MCSHSHAGSFFVIDPCIAVTLDHNPECYGAVTPTKRMSVSDIHASCRRQRRSMRIFSRCLVHPGNMILLLPSGLIKPCPEISGQTRRHRSRRLASHPAIVLSVITRKMPKNGAKWQPGKVIFRLRGDGRARDCLFCLGVASRVPRQSAAKKKSRLVRGGINKIEEKAANSVFRQCAESMRFLMACQGTIS